MNFDSENFNNELDGVLTFWLTNALVNNKIIAELSVDNMVNPNANLGSMYLSRIIYGASAASKMLKTNKYKNLADTAFQILITEFKNPIGGFYWAKTPYNLVVHDADNMNMAQAFILYGLVEYASIYPYEKLLTEIDNQAKFIIDAITDKEYGGYIDGFDQNWKPFGVQTKALGTHLHLLEAFAKLYEFNQNPKLTAVIEELINLILHKFIEPETLDCLHRLTPDWKPLENFIWSGHNAECSWIICKAAALTKNQKLINECHALAVKTMDNVLTYAWDKKRGGIFNALKNNLPAEKCKVWWPQAETVTALLNCYKITNNIGYKTQALELIQYISANFIYENGEWLTELNENGQPDFSVPKIHFWKALYHNVRYYIEVNERLQNC